MDPSRVGEGIGPVTRRTVLAAAAGGLAGCTDVLPDQAEAKELELGEGRGVSVAATADVDPALEVAYDVEVTRDEIARSGPAIVRISFTNEAEEARSFEFGPRPPFSATSPVDSDQYLLVDGRVFEYPQACYEPNLDEGEAYELPDETTVVDLAAGEAASVLLEVWGSHRTEECLPPGTYTFADGGRVVDGPEFSWSFDLAIERIEVEPTPG